MSDTQMVSKTERMYFTIEGEFISNFARTRVQEGAWEAGLKMLVEDLGMTYEQAIQIAKGEATLTGSAQVGGPETTLEMKMLSPNGEIAEEMNSQLDYMYGNVFKYKDAYWKPYAIVNGWDGDDSSFATGYAGSFSIVTNGSRSKNKGGLRSLYYAKSASNDMLVIINEESKFDCVDILCERLTTTPPIWLDIPTNNPVDFLTARNNMGKLKLTVYGASGAGAVFDVAPPVENPEEQACGFTAAFLSDLENAKTVEEIKVLERKYEAMFSAIQSASAGISSAEWDKKEAAHARAQQEFEKVMAAQVKEQADKCGGWYTLRLADERNPNYVPASIEVPRNPFILWALRGFRFEDYGKERPEWTCVAESGWKMGGDNPLHTDWMLGAGVPLEDAYARDDVDENGQEVLASRVRGASFSAAATLVDEMTGVEFVILAGGGEGSEHDWVGGDVVHAQPNKPVPAGSVAIAPHAGPEYQLAMISANKKNSHGRYGVLICETGGKLAHLAVVGREQNCTVLMIPDALKKYKNGDHVFICLGDKTVHSHV